MLNEHGGVIDDLIAYFRDERWFRLVVNAATRDKDMVWINVQAAAFDVEVRERPELAMIAVQGPNAREKMASLLSAQGAAAAAKLGKFVGADIDDLFIARRSEEHTSELQSLMRISSAV